MKDSTLPTLLQQLFKLLQAHRSAFRQERTFERAISLLMGELFSFARHTVTQSLLVLGLTDADWSGWYRLFSRPRFDEEELNGCLLAQTLEHVGADQPYVIGVDATQVPRSSLKMPGTSWLRASGTAPFKPGIHRAQRFVHGSWLVPIQQGFSRAIPLRFLAAFPEKAQPAGEAPCKEWAAGVNFIQWVRGQLDRHQRSAQPLLVLGDGAYDKVEFWKGLPERTFGAVRTAKNRILRELPGPYQGKGRKPIYGPQAKHPHDWLAVVDGWQQDPVAVRGRQLQLTYRVEGPYLRQGLPNLPVFLIVVRGDTWLAGKKEPKRKSREPCYYLVSARKVEQTWALPFPILWLLGWLWQRWELEVTHRELKSGLGLGEKQCWNLRSAVVSVQWSAWLYAVLVLAGFRTWGFFNGPKTPARWWPGAKRWSLSTLWRAYRSACWGNPDFRPVWTSSTDNWLKKEDYLHALWNSVIASARI